MKNPEAWEPTKYVFRNRHLTYSRNPRQVGVYSRHFVELVAGFYQSVVPEFAHGRLIDLGCGKVPLFQLYQEKVASITTVDWPASPHGGKHVDVECDLNTKLPFENAAFDTIVLSDVLEHLRNPSGLWDEMQRMLRPNGVILMNTPFFYWLHEEPHDFYRYTPHMLREFAVSRGMEVVRIEPLGGAFEILIDIKSKVAYYGVPWVGSTLAACLQWIGSVFSKSYLGRLLRRRTSTKFALGYGMVVRKPR